MSPKDDYSIYSVHDLKIAGKKSRHLSILDNKKNETPFRLGI